MEEIKLSIIICTYNRANLLVEALESVIQQKTTFPFEIIVGDDCSTDNTSSVLSEYRMRFPNKIRVVRHETNLGLGGNWAAALLQAKGKYVAFLDDDDYWIDCHRIQIMVDYMESHSEVDVLYTNGYKYFEKTGKKELICLENSAELDVHKIWVGQQPNISMDFVVAKRSAIVERISLEDYVKYQFPIQDWGTHIILLGKNAHYASMDLPSCVIRIADGSMSRPKTYDEVEKKYKKEKIMHNYVADQFPDDPIIYHDDKEFDSYVNHVLLNVAYKRGDYRRAKYYRKLSGGHSLKYKCAHTWVTFQMFRLLKRIMRDE